LRSFAIALSCLLAASAAMADTPTPTGVAPTVSVKAIKFNPPLTGIMAAGVRSGLRYVSTSVTVAYDELGNVVSVKLDKRTGDKSLDRAIIAWAAMLKIQADGAGSGSIPIKMRLDG
jgi:hypothetical protein